MALTDTKDLPGPSLFARLRGRVEDQFAGEHSLTQRMAGTAFAIRVASAGILFVSQVLLARWMGSYAFGTYVYVWTWLLLVGDIVHLSVPLTAQRYVPEYSQSGALDLLRGYLVGSRWITFGFAAAVALAGAALVTALRPALDPDLVLPLYCACAALPLYAFTFMLDGLSRSYNWINLALLPPYVVRPLVLILAVAALRAAGIRIDATVVAATLAASVWFTALVQLGLLEHRLRGVVPKGPKTYDVRNWLGTALPMVLVWGMYTLLTSTDVLVLREFRPANEVAHYYAAAKTLALVSMIHFAVAAAAGHRFTTYAVAGDRAGLAGFAADTVRWVFWPSLGITLLMLAVGKPVLSLFGAGFTQAYPVMAILSLGLLARAAVGPAERLLNMLGEQRICSVAYAAAFAVNIIGCFALAPAYGGVGVASATAAAFVTESALLFLIVARRLGLTMLIFWPRRG